MLSPLRDRDHGDRRGLLARRPRPASDRRGRLKAHGGVRRVRPGPQADRLRAADGPWSGDHEPAHRSGNGAEPPVRGVPRRCARRRRVSGDEARSGGRPSPRAGELRDARASAAASARGAGAAARGRPSRPGPHDPALEPLAAKSLHLSQKKAAPLGPRDGHDPGPGAGPCRMTKISEGFGTRLTSNGGFLGPRDASDRHDAQLLVNFSLRNGLVQKTTPDYSRDITYDQSYSFYRKSGPFDEIGKSQNRSRTGPAPHLARGRAVDPRADRGRGARNDHRS